MKIESSSQHSISRCEWCLSSPEYIAYHDHEWGFPVEDDIRLFEKLSLESFQSGLSWRTILAKRDNFRAAFCGFDFNLVAKFDEQDVERLLSDAGIVRHRGKIEATINNAQRMIELIEREGSFARYIWGFESEIRPLANPQTVSTTEVSAKISKLLKKQGWKFVGPTTVYSFMQAMGLVNDHTEACEFRDKVSIARKNFTSPAGK